LYRGDPTAHQENSQGYKLDKIYDIILVEVAASSLKASFGIDDIASLSPEFEHTVPGEF